MSYCNKGINSTDILENMSENELDFILIFCEQNCGKYYQCDTISLMNDRIKELHGE